MDRQGFAALQDLFGWRGSLGTSAQTPAGRAEPGPAIAATNRAATSVAPTRLRPAVRLLFDMRSLPPIVR
jgi:hypothetical protein